MHVINVYKPEPAELMILPKCIVHKHLVMHLTTIWETTD